MTEPSSAEARLIALEERYCHQAKLLEELSEALAAQQRSLDLLALRLERLEQRQAEAPDDLGDGPL